MSRTIYHPVGPVGSIFIGAVLCGIHLAGLATGVWALWMLGMAFILGGLIMLIARIMSNKKNTL